LSVSLFFHTIFSLFASVPFCPSHMIPKYCRPFLAYSILFLPLPFISTSSLCFPVLYSISSPSVTSFLALILLIS
jgi:hypothetical protein